MSAVDEIKARLDIVSVLGQYVTLKKHGRNYVGLCPFHAEKTPSFVIWTESQTWRCFGSCGTGGDIFKFVMKHDNLDFHQAFEMLAQMANLTPEELARQPRKPAAKPRFEEPSQPPLQAWQDTANRIVEHAQCFLWGKEGGRALDYLRKERGLVDRIIKEARLGYIPGHYTQWKYTLGLKVPCGISIPWYADGALWGVKVRRSAGKPKYVQIGTQDQYLPHLGKANLSGALYGADDILPGIPALICEGEFDRLIVWQEAPDLCSPVTVGSNSGHINPLWYPAMASCDTILVALDEDGKSEEAKEKMMSLGKRFRRLSVPQGKDITDYFLANRRDSRAMYKWILSALQAASLKEIA